METSSKDARYKLEVSYRLLFERNPVPMWVYDVQALSMLAVNEAALAHYGYSRQEFVGLTLLDLHTEDDAAQLQEQLGLPSTQQSQPRRWQHRRRDGSLIEVEVTSQDLEFEGIRARLVRVIDLTEQCREEQAQRDLAYQLAITLEGVTDALFTLDRDWCFTYVNAQAEKLFCSRREELLGFSIWDKFPPASVNDFQARCRRAVTECQQVSFETYHASIGEWRAVVAYPSAQGLVVYARDVTAKRVAEQRLLEERETFAAVLNSAADAIISMDVEGQIKMFNPGAERIFRYTQADMQGQNMDVLLPERFRAAHGAHLHRFGQSGKASRMMGLGLVKGLRADGQELDLEGTISQVRVHQQQVLIVCFRDVTQRVRADAEFAQSRAQLSGLTQRLMMQEKMLVKRLAQALHDQLGQTVAAIRMAHETIITLQGDKIAPGVERLQAQMSTLISQAIRQVRQVLIDLRPPLLEEQGLAAALDNELRNRSLMQPQVDISINVSPEVELMRWPTEVEYAAFMVAREAVENALRHSGASLVAVRLSGVATSLQLEISDNGVGITTPAPARIGHLGILGMHERAQAIGAAVVVDSGDGAGTRVSFNWQCAP